MEVKPLPGNVTSIAHLKGVVDETGQSITVRAPRRRKRRKGWRDHVSLLDIDVIVRLGLNGGETRILFAVMAHVPEKGGCDSFVTGKKIAEELGVSQQYVAGILRTLRERHIAWSTGYGQMHVNAWIMYNGDFDSWNAEAEEDPEPIWGGVDPTTGEIR
jgi:hypothetical protein